MSPARASIKLELHDESGSMVLAQDLAVILKSGDFLCLSGSLGVGKTIIARAIIRTIAGDPEIEVPSPTYTIEQVYATSPGIRHFDFYRLQDASEVAELGLEEAAEDNIIIVEWPEIYAQHLPESAVMISIKAVSEDAREIEISAPQPFLDRFERSLAIREFLNRNWARGLDRQPLTGDASTRAYELVTDGDEIRVLMNAQRQADGPVIPGFGKPYSQIAHLAEEVSAFVAIDKLLLSKGFAAPKIYASDLDQGLLLTEYLGSGSVITNDRKPIRERYLVAVELLGEMHLLTWPDSVSVEAGRIHRIASYDRQAIAIETGLFTDWYMPEFLQRSCNEVELEEFERIWDGLFARLSMAPTSIVLRDYHSPNLIWLEAREGTDRIGLIDFQDALIGPQSYDVASLAQDGRVDVSEELEAELLEHYIAFRKEQAGEFDEALFRESYAIMAAQRATKLLGIFVRLHKRDNKPEYLKHLPRIRDYLDRCFRHPVLADYQRWFTKVMNGTEEQ